MKDQSGAPNVVSDSAYTPFPNSGEGLSFLEILVVLARNKRLVLAFPFCCAVIAALISLALPNVYTGTARVLPPQQSSVPIAALLTGDISSGAGAAVGQALGLKNPSDLYVGILQSRTVADAIIRRFDLQNLYDQKTMFDTRKKLAAISKITASQDGIIAIEIDDKEPTRAAEMANAYVEELDKLNQTVAISTASRQRLFLEKQLQQVKEQLSEAEVAMRTTQEKTGLISVTEQGKAMIESVASLRALLAAKQVQLAALRIGTTENNPEYIRAQQELAGLRTELAKLERSNPTDSGGVIPSAGKIPQAGLEYVRRFRDVQYYQTLFELLAKGYEIARSQEAAEGGVVQVLDRAVIPDKKSKPHRALIVLVTGVLTGLLGMLLAFGQEARERASRDPNGAKLIAEIRHHMKRWGQSRKAPNAP